MKKIKYMSLVIIVLITFSKCNSYDDSFEDTNKAPVILVKPKTADDYLPGLIDSFKIENQNYIFDFKIEDEQEDLEISCQIEKDTTLKDTAEIIIQQEGNTLTVVKPILGENIITLKTTDGFGAKDTCTINLTVFDNLPPVAEIKVVENVDIPHSQYERQLDGSDSYDRDAKFGGKIIVYEFRIGNGVPIQTIYSKINYIFPQQGNFRLSLRVKDHNNIWSEIKTTNYNLF